MSITNLLGNLHNLVALLESTKLSPVHTKGGKYYMKRAKDSRIVPMQAALARKMAAGPPLENFPSTPADNDPLAIYYVPPEYVKAKEGLWRIKTGWIKPLWDWGRGPLKEPPYRVGW